MKRLYLSSLGEYQLTTTVNDRGNTVVHGLPIMRPGIWNDTEFSADDLRQVAANHVKLQGEQGWEPPMRPQHYAGGEDTLGWICGCNFDEGDQVLKGDVEVIDPAMLDNLKGRKYRYGSAEIDSYDLGDGTKLSPVLTGAAFVPNPAVLGLPFTLGALAFAQNLDDFPELLEADFASLLPLAPEGNSWDAGAATAAVKAWATSGDTINFAKYGRAFLWHAPNPSKQGDFKLPFATVIDGSLHAVWGGIHAALGRLGSTQIPDADKAAVKSRIRAYYRAFGKEFPADSQHSALGANGGLTMKEKLIAALKELFHLEATPEQATALAQKIGAEAGGAPPPKDDTAPATDPRLAQVMQANAEMKAQLEAQETRLATLAANDRAREIGAFVDALVTAGKVPPAKRQEVLLLAQAQWGVKVKQLDAQGAEVEVLATDLLAGLFTGVKGKPALVWEGSDGAEVVAPQISDEMADSMAAKATGKPPAKATG